ncbi:MAG: acetylornithine transaminase [Marmoricola sp.]
MNAPSILEQYPTALMNTFGPPRLALVRGKGSHVWDDAGNEYVDLFGGIAVNALGHAHPALVKAVKKQMKTLGHVSNFFATGPQVELAAKLVELLGGDGRVFLSNSGAEANETAFKISRRTGRTRIVAMEGSFHGRTMGALALTSKAAYREPFAPLPGDVTFVPYNDLPALEAAVDDTVAAIIIEPLQGEAGVVEPSQGFLPAARAIASRHGALLWLDEVQTGVGRTGAWFGHDPQDLRPDLVTLAKGLGGGIPIGATVALGDAANLLQPGNHGSTFGGNPVAAAAALAVIDTIEDYGLLEAVQRKGATLRAILESAPEVDFVQGAGLLLGAQLKEETAPAVVSRGQEHGFLLNNTGPSRLRFAPPLIIDNADLSAFGEAWPTIVGGSR